MTPNQDRSVSEKRYTLVRSLASGIFLVLVFMAVAWAAPGILRPRAMEGLLADSTPLLILVLGSTMPILLGCLDLSVAAIASLSATAVALLIPHLGSAAVPFVLFGAVIAGALQGYIIGVFQISSFIVTLGSLGIFSGLALYLSNATTIEIDADTGVFDALNDRTLSLPNVLIVLLFVWMLLVLLLRYTRVGRDLYYFGAGELASYMSGIPRNATRATAFGISAFCGALAGITLLSQTLYSSPTMANDLLLPAIVGVVVGGTAISGGVGGITLSLIGGLTIIFVRIGATVAGFPGTAQDIVFGAIILIAVALTTDRGKIAVLK